MKQEVLKLNKSFYPIGLSGWKKVFVDIVSGSAYPIDIMYGQTEDGKIDKFKIESFDVIRDFEQWAALPIREFDDYVTTTKTAYRLPPIVVCSEFNRIIHKHVVFPTKNNIWKRDNYTCGYSGKKLTREDVSVDHIMPVSRGGGNTWENLITCDRELNTWKADRTPKEAGLKLLWKPYKPNNGMVFSFMRKEWEMFLGGGDYDSL